MELFFDNSTVPIEKVGLSVSIYLSRNTSRVRYTVRETGLSIATVVDWFSFIREVLMYWMHKQSAKIGGPGKIVEIDEAKFGRRKYHRGRLLTGQWVLGGIERLEGGGADKQKMFLIPVPDRTSQTLVAIIKEYVLPGTTIMTDCWASYSTLAENDYLHLTVNPRVNHPINFVDPASGAHTQNIERSWVEVRRYVPRSGLVRQHHTWQVVILEGQIQIIVCDDIFFGKQSLNSILLWIILYNNEVLTILHYLIANADCYNLYRFGTPLVPVNVCVCRGVCHCAVSEPY